MKDFARITVRTAIFLTLVTAFVTSMLLLPGQFGTKAKTRNPDRRGLVNYDIRIDRESAETLASFRGVVGRDSTSVKAIRDNIVRGGEGLRAQSPGVIVEYSDRLGHAEVISPDVRSNTTELITGPSNLAKRPETLRNFLKQNASLVCLDELQVDSLKVTADYANPDGNLSFAHLEQSINGVPVFAGEVKAGFDRNGKVVRVINNLAPGLDYESLSKDFGDAPDAVRSAAKFMNVELRDEDTIMNRSSSTDLKAVFGGSSDPQSKIQNPKSDDWATTAEKMYFPTEPGVAVPAWRVLIWQPVDTYYVIVDAATGTMLWRKNITEDQTQPATYNVYRNANAYIDVADSPAPFTPGPNSPDGSQSAVISRQDVTLIGNEGTNSFNNLGWIDDGRNEPDGNFNEAGVDRDGINGVDVDLVFGSPLRVFSSTWNPPPGNPSPGDDALTEQSQRGAVTQMFYVMNRYHDELYKRGWVESSFNFQHNNFGRGGLGNDRVSSEGQDSSGVNNANFSTPADGSRPRMQMYLWTNPTPDRDGTADADIIIHEVTHGLSNRLHGNSSGLSTNMSRGMGEGWGDFYGHTMLAEPTDPIDGIHTTGGYSTYLGASGFVSNYYYGIRRFPKAVISFTGPNGKPHNPLTFRYMNNNCNTLIGSTTSNPPPNSAFPRGPYGSSTCDQVHNLGEIWSSALWEVRALMIARLGFTAGTERVLQVVTDGMKLSPTGPTFLQARDAIISAAETFSTADRDDVREGFRRRGMGFSASIQNTGSGANNTAVTEAFDTWPTGPTLATVSGFVTRASNGRGLGGVTMTLLNTTSGATSTTTTAGNGSYSFANVTTGFTYRVTPTLNRYTFTPTSRDILVNGNVSGVNFAGTRQ